MNEIEAKVLTRVFCDSKPAAPFILYLVCNTVDNELSVISPAVSLWKTRYTLIGVMDGRTDKGYAGYERWLNVLRVRGVPKDSVLKIPGPYDTPFNTLTEAQALMAYLKGHSLVRVAITSSAFHHLRAFMTFVSVAIREYPELKIYSLAGEVQEWEQEVVHSQGVQRDKRKNLIGREWQKILEYQEKGDICSFEDILKYMDKRDSR